MRTIPRRALSVCAIALFTLVGAAAAQTTSSAVLNSLEVQALITRAAPADHARLEVHFAVLAEQYAADAKRHNAMATDHVASAQAYRGTRIVQAAVHCDRLVALSRASAKDATEAAAIHKQLASVAR